MSRRVQLGVVLGLLIFLVAIGLLWTMVLGSSGAPAPVASQAPADRSVPAERKRTPSRPQPAASGTPSEAPPEEDPVAGGEPEAAPEAAADPPAPDGASIADGIRQAIAENVGRVKFCYEKALQRDPEISGRVTLEMVVEGGILIDVAWAEDETYDDVFLTCVEDKLIGIDVGSGYDGDITWPFVFMTAEEAP